MKTYRHMKSDELGDQLNRQLSEELACGHSAGGAGQDELFTFAGFDRSASERVGYSNYSYWGATIRAFFKNKVAVFFLILMAATLLFTFLQPYLPNQLDPNTVYYNETGALQGTVLPGKLYSNVAPGDQFWFGTNSIGQDLWARIWSGTRTSLGIGFAVACVEAIVGILVGVLWGYVRKLDFFFTEVYNIFDNIPQTLVLILMSYVLKPGVGTIIFALCLTGWLGMARFIRNQIVIIRDRDYNLASRCLGTPTRRIIFKNLLPYLVSVITLRMALAIPAAIGNEVFVTYIGIGLPTEIPSLGNLIQAGRKLMQIAALRYQLLFPVTVLAIITISFYIIGNAFADAADPKNHV